MQSAQAVGAPTLRSGVCRHSAIHGHCTKARCSAQLMQRMQAVDVSLEGSEVCRCRAAGTCCRMSRKARHGPEIVQYVQAIGVAIARSMMSRRHAIFIS